MSAAAVIFDRDHQVHADSRAFAARCSVCSHLSCLLIVGLYIEVAGSREKFIRFLRLADVCLGINTAVHDSERSRAAGLSACAGCDQETIVTCMICRHIDLRKGRSRSLDSLCDRILNVRKRDALGCVRFHELLVGLDLRSVFNTAVDVMAVDLNSKSCADAKLLAIAGVCRIRYSDDLAEAFALHRERRICLQIDRRSLCDERAGLIRHYVNRYTSADRSGSLGVSCKCFDYGCQRCAGCACGRLDIQAVRVDLAGLDVGLVDDFGNTERKCAAKIELFGFLLLVASGIAASGISAVVVAAAGVSTFVIAASGVSTLRASASASGTGIVTRCDRRSRIAFAVSALAAAFVTAFIAARCDGRSRITFGVSTLAAAFITARCITAFGIAARCIAALLVLLLFLLLCVGLRSL